MKVVSVRRRSGSVAGVVTAMAVGATLVVVPAHPVIADGLARQHHAVQLQAVTASAVLNAAGAQPSIEVPAEVSALPAPSGPRANAGAAATGSPNLFAVAAAIGLGALLLPIWYLTFPVTLPMTVLVIGALGGVCSGCFSGNSYASSNPLAYIILPAIGYWLTGPIQGIYGVLSSAFSPQAASVAAPAAAAAAAASVRRKVAGAKDVRRPTAVSSGKTRAPAKAAATRDLAISDSQDRAERTANAVGKRSPHLKR